MSFVTTRKSIFLLLSCLLILLSGCASAIGVREVDLKSLYSSINVNALSEDKYSFFSKAVLNRYNLVKDFKKSPADVLAFLKKQALDDYRSDTLFALAELNFLTANRLRKSEETDKREQAQSYYFASCIYAYFYLFGEKWLDPPGPFDRRFRVACDLYNSSLALALTNGDGTLDFNIDTITLPTGEISLVKNTENFPFALDHFQKYISADRFLVRGLSVRNRKSGLGAPFIAVENITADVPAYRSVPGSLFLSLNCQLANIEDGECEGVLQFYYAFDEKEIEIADRKVPLETDITTQIAYNVDQPYFKKFGIRQFLKGEGYIKNGVYLSHTYDPKKIPVLFVHGTVSSPATWAEMVNTLYSDPYIRQNYQFWYYLYDSGKKIIYSTIDLRDSLSKMVKTFDPEGKNPLLREMVIIGHSQGGLLTKLTAIDSGDEIFKMIFKKGPEELDLPETQRDLITRYTMLKPLPFVKRVVFIATPHRGSFRSKNWIRSLAIRLINLPKDILHETVSITEAIAAAGVSTDFIEKFRTNTSLDAMSPDNKIIHMIAGIPLSQSIKGHSIIAIDGDDNPPDGDDGVVKYTSAHVDYVDSEFIVRDEHSCQSNPLVIEEVRRILLEHLHD